MPAYPLVHTRFSVSPASDPGITLAVMPCDQHARLDTIYLCIDPRHRDAWAAWVLSLEPAPAEHTPTQASHCRWCAALRCYTPLR